MIASLLFFIFITTCSAQQIETERTILLPWTLEHTCTWEKIEQEDTAPSEFRRNQHFESLDQLCLRDKNWLELRKKLLSLHNNTIIFPDLGFAILRKTDQELIGIICTKTNDSPGCMSFGYALRPEIRSCKFGQEVIKAFTAFIATSITSPTLAFKTNIDKAMFIEKWKDEGKKENPDFDQLISFFEEQPVPLQKMIACVNVKNPASFAILMRNGMQPFEVECEKYIVDNSRNYFVFDVLLQYPSNQHDSREKIEALAADILSRDQNRINQAYDKLKELFNIADDSIYMQMSFAEKAVFKPLSKMVSSTLLSEVDITKTIKWRTYYPPYCLIR